MRWAGVHIKLGQVVVYPKTMQAGIVVHLPAPFGKDLGVRFGNGDNDQTFAFYNYKEDLALARGAMREDLIREGDRREEAARQRFRDEKGVTHGK